MGIFRYTVPLVTPELIGNAYAEAIHMHVERLDDIWDASIRLVELRFQSNFRRSEYEAIFEITDTNNESPDHA